MTNYIRELNLTYSPLHNKYRSRMEIIAVILEAVKYNSVTRYPLMKYTSINYAQLEKYLDPLAKKGFIEVDIKKGKALYRASEKGLAFLRQYNILRNMLL